MYVRTLAKFVELLIVLQYKAIFAVLQTNPETGAGDGLGDGDG